MTELQQFVHNVALECDALERVFSQETLNYHRTPELLGKQWYAVGLESNDVDTVKDSGNKQNLIQRLIEYIRGFIATVIERIKKFFGDGSNSKKNAEFIRNYKGPTDNDYAKLLFSHVKDLASKDEAVKERLKALPAPAAAQPTLAEAEEQLAAATGKTVTQETKKSIFREKKLEQVSSALGVTRLSIICTMLSKEFSAAFQEASNLCDSITNKRVFRDNIDEHAAVGEKIAALTKQCNEMINQESEDNKHLAAWILNDDSQVVGRALGYVSTDVVVIYASHYMKGLDVIVKEFKTEDSEESLRKLQTSQRMLVNLVTFISLATKVSQSYDVVIKAIRGF